MIKNIFFLAITTFIFFFFSCKKATVNPGILTPPLDSIEVKNITIVQQLRSSDPPAIGYDMLAQQFISLEKIGDATNVDIAFEGASFHAGAHFTLASKDPIIVNIIYENSTTFVKVNGEINYAANVTKQQVKDLFIKKQNLADQLQNQIEGDLYIGKIRNQDIYILFKITRVRLTTNVSDMTFDCKIWK